MSQLFFGRFLKYLDNLQLTLRVLRICWARKDRELADFLSKKAREVRINVIPVGNSDRIMAAAPRNTVCHYELST
jgi:hypothetical protein